MVDLYTQYYPVVVFEWILFAITTPFVFVRLYVQLRFRRHPWREIFVVIAWLLYLSYTIEDSMLSSMDLWNYGVDWSKMTDEDLKPMHKVQFAQTLVFKNALYACKAALLCFYGDITQRYSRTWWAIAFGWGWITAGALFQVLMVLLQCRPIKLNFYESSACYTDNHFIIPANIASWCVHTLSDALVYAIPFFIYRKISSRLSTRQKKVLYVLFALGLFNMLSAIVVTVNLIMANTGMYEALPAFSLRFDYAAYFLIPFQPGSAIIIICLPYCRRLLGGTKAEDLRPELNEGNMAVWRAAAGADDVEASAATTSESHNEPHEIAEKEKSTQTTVAVEEKY